MSEHQEINTFFYPGHIYPCVFIKIHKFVLEQVVFNNSIVENIVAAFRGMHVSPV